MKDQLENRLEELRAELESGQRVLADLQAKETQIRDTLSRLQGAIQVIEEELGKANTSTPIKTAPAPLSGRIRERP